MLNHVPSVDNRGETLIPADYHQRAVLHVDAVFRLPHRIFLARLARYVESPLADVAGSRLILPGEAALIMIKKLLSEDHRIAAAAIRELEILQSGRAVLVEWRSPDGTAPILVEVTALLHRNRRGTRERIDQRVARRRLYRRAH